MCGSQMYICPVCVAVRCLGVRVSCVCGSWVYLCPLCVCGSQVYTCPVCVFGHQMCVCVLCVAIRCMQCLMCGSQVYECPVCVMCNCQVYACHCVCERDHPHALGVVVTKLCKLHPHPWVPCVLEEPYPAPCWLPGPGVLALWAPSLHHLLRAGKKEAIRFSIINKLSHPNLDF